MKKNNVITTTEEKEYFFSTRIGSKDFLVYSSDPFKLSEIDLINLIKVCLIEARNKTIGKKILAVYRDSTSERKDLTKQRLELIGVKEDLQPSPTREKKPKTK